MLQIKLLLHGRQNKVKKVVAGGGVDFGDGIKQPLGIETEALILDFSRLKALFKKQFDNIISQPGQIEESYNPLNIDISDLDIDLFPVK